MKNLIRFNRLLILVVIAYSKTKMSFIIKNVKKYARRCCVCFVFAGLLYEFPGVNQVDSLPPVPNIDSWYTRAPRGAVESENCKKTKEFWSL